MTETDTSREAVERPCPNCGVTLNGWSGLRHCGHCVTHAHADCISNLRRRAEKAEAERDELDALLNEGIATDEDTRLKARNAALREAAGIAFEADDCYIARNSILALLDTPAPEPAMTVGGWQPIETAPKDGTAVVIARADWDCHPVAEWMDYPGNPVCDESGQDCYMSGWGHDCIGFTKGHEDYWLGWSDDPMPTHWMPLPTPPQEDSTDD